MRRIWNINDFEIDKKIGDGQYSKVYLAKEKNIQKNVALKVVANKIFGKKISEEQFRKEIKIQHNLNHNNILKLFGFFNDEKAKYIVLEFCEFGEMYKDIRMCKGYSNERAATYMYQLANALDYCFDYGIIHRDIKSENILISKSGAVKLADFGWCARFINKKRQTFCGTLDYISPEVVYGEAQDEKVDIWCLGVLLFEMLTTTTPFFSLDKLEFYSNIKFVKFVVPDIVHTLARFMILNILRRCIYERLTAKQIMIHPYVNKFSEKTLTSCTAAYEQWSSMKEDSVKPQDIWSFSAKCPTIDFNNEAPNDIDINSPGKENKDESYSLMKEITKKKELKKCE